MAKGLSTHQSRLQTLFIEFQPTFDVWLLPIIPGRNHCHAIVLKLAAEEPALTVLSVRIMLNALYAAYEMDSGEPLITSRATSNKFMSADFVKNTERVMVKFGDARLGFYAAEAAMFLGRRYIAERLVRASMKADGYNGAFPLWMPTWHPRPPSE